MKTNLTSKKKKFVSNSELKPFKKRDIQSFSTDGSRSGLNFINVLRTAFTLVDPKSVKRY